MPEVARHAGTSHRARRPRGMGLILYILGFIVLVSGLAWLATLVGVSQPLIGGFALLMLAVAAIHSIASARARARESQAA